jgi:hypothetical protein
MIMHIPLNRFLAGMVELWYKMNREEYGSK